MQLCFRLTQVGRRMSLVVHLIGAECCGLNDRPTGVCILCIACFVVLFVMSCYAMKFNASFNNTRCWQNKCMICQFSQISDVQKD